jgi:hypothetical protein
MKMKRCKECGKKLRVLEGYRHPVLGKDILICRDCFDSVHDGVVKWREAHLPYIDFFKKNSKNKRNKTIGKNIVTCWLNVRKCIN